jgi:SAM-dependent methyltransferase
MAKTAKIWDQFYKDNKYTMWYPSESIVRFLSRFVKGLPKSESPASKRGLDFGCGNGRHIVLLAKMGLKAYGTDISSASIDMARQFVDRENLTANLSTCKENCPLPYKNAYFDIALSYGVIDHMSMKEGLFAVNEMHRVLKKDGLICLTLRGTRDFEYGKGNQIEKNVFIIEGDCEGNLPQHFFSGEEIEQLLSNFKNIAIECEERAFGKNLSYIYSRWIVTARK